LILNSNASKPGLGFGSSAGKCNNPGALADNSSIRFAKVGIPSIPSRFFTPILKFDFNEKDLGYELFDTVIGSN